MTKRVPLNTSASAVFSAAGTATVILGPTVYGHTWNVKRMITSTTSTTRSELRVYLNGVTPSNLQAGSYNGNLDFNETDVWLQNLDKFSFVWTLGTPGATATIQLVGIIEDAR